MDTLENELIEAFNKGYHSYQLGHIISTNPYQNDYPKYKEWVLGFESAEIDTREDDDE